MTELLKIQVRNERYARKKILGVRGRSVWHHSASLVVPDIDLQDIVFLCLTFKFCYSASLNSKVFPSQIRIPSVLVPVW